jgi:hypothetical protein
MHDETAVKLTDAIIRQSVTNELVVGALERLEARMAVQPSAPMFDPRTLVVKTILVCSVASLVGSVTALAWAAL